MRSSVMIHAADWGDDRDTLSAIRRKVFIEEQNVPEEMEWDVHDASSTHFLATADHTAVATARLKPDGQIGRMAVLPGYRNTGIGTELLKFVLHEAAARHFKKLYLHAQLSAVPFYEKQGFVAQGDVFYEADIPHRNMQLIL